MDVFILRTRSTGTNAFLVVGRNTPREVSTPVFNLYVFLFVSFPFIFHVSISISQGLSPLWMRQIPYTMMKFACFEKTVEALYQYVVPKPRAECNKAEQLGVTFIAGYIAGVFCAVVSHPADTVVSKLNANPGIKLNCK